MNSLLIALTYFTLGINIHHFVLAPQVLVEKESKKGITKKLKKNKDKKKSATSVTVWDFAGQEVYVLTYFFTKNFFFTLLLTFLPQYATHQFFLLPKSIYCLVFSLVNPASQDCLEYWYRSIKVLLIPLCRVLSFSH